MSSLEKAVDLTTPRGWEGYLAEALGRVGPDGPVAALRHIMDGLRPRSAGTPEARARIEALTRHLESAAPATRLAAAELVRRACAGARVYPALTASGVPGGEGFLAELAGRVTRRVLPPVEEDSDLRDLIRRVFPERHDHEWIASVPDRLWAGLLDALGVSTDSDTRIDPELALAIRTLTHHVASLGLQPEVTARLPHLVAPSSAFLQLGERVLRYLRSVEGESDEADGDGYHGIDSVLEAVDACVREVDLLRTETHAHGTSLWLTSLSYRLLRLLDRLELLLHVSAAGDEDFEGSAVRLFKEIVRSEKTRDRVLPHIRASADLLALEVVEHAARKGSKYITTGRRDYGWFLVSSMGGGFLVALFSLAKIVMGHWQVSLAAEAVLYGLNYAVCFVLIYLTGATLATKQPAMTANTVARSLGEGEADLGGLEELVVRVWRSQFVSFVGNLVVALPVALLLSEIYLQVTGSTVAGPEQATAMLGDLHPWRSGTLAYAAVAGVLLFAAGLVSGWVDNWVRFRRVPTRVAAHRGLTRVLGADRAARWGRAIDAKLGAVVGNIFLGFGLGSMGTIGEIFGLPLDIRHIAFASAEFGTALEILRYEVPVGLVVAVGAGVAAIGLINFLVSFGLSLMIALESRRLSPRSLFRLTGSLARRFLRRPLEWFVPPAPRPARAHRGA